MLFHDSAARELRRLGSRISAETRRAARGTAGLTERERDIAGLVAAGKSNKEVAASLFLSEKTIEHHLSRIYAKLGVRSRVELAGRGVGDGLTRSRRVRRRRRAAGRSRRPGSPTQSGRLLSS